ncbi:MAG: hypothetical protein SGI77_23115 [Pirellulaceae bacterium]|nr:hypothetical protein [Pirellulaceae bacterium]
MADGARVQDVAAIVDFQAFLGRFRDDLSTRCDEVSLNFQRVSAWLDGEGSAYWRTEKLRAEQRFAEAHQGLAMCRAKTREDDRESCTDQVKQLEKAMARLALCELRHKQLKACQLEWEQFKTQALPRVAEATDLIETQLPRARGELAKILTILEQYLQS